MALSRHSLEARHGNPEVLPHEYPAELRKSLGQTSRLGDIIAEIDETLATQGVETVAAAGSVVEDEIVLVLPEVHYYKKEELPSAGKAWDDDSFTPAIDLNLMDGAIGTNYWHPAA